MSIFTFSTSTNVSPQLFQGLNAGLIGYGGRPMLSNTFVPAAREPSKTSYKTQSADVTYNVEYFDGITDVDLQKLYESEYVQLTGSHLHGHIGKFAVLDERSTQDKIVVFWYQHEDIIDEEADLVGPKYWISWRLAFQYAYYMFETLDEGAQEIIYCDFVERKDEFTSEDGIFDLATLFGLDKTVSRLNQTSAEAESRSLK